MTKTRKFLTLAMAVSLLVAIGIGVTVAYFTDEASVVNTFTVGNVRITLDELDVDNSTDGDNDRDQANAYHLIPGQLYVKDPKVHVAANSEDCWLFVKVENGIAKIESEETDDYTPIAKQILDKGWIALDGVSDVYYQAYVASGNKTDFVVFENFKIDGDVTNTELADYETTDANKVTITVTAYAVQKAGFDKAEDAWSETFGK